MVLQCAPSRANIWGWAKQSDIGLQVTVTLKNSVIRDDTHLYKALVRSGERMYFIHSSCILSIIISCV